MDKNICFYCSLLTDNEPSYFDESVLPDDVYRRIDAESGDFNTVFAMEITPSATVLEFLELANTLVHDWILMSDKIIVSGTLGRSFNDSDNIPFDDTMINVYFKDVLRAFMYRPDGATRIPIVYLNGKGTKYTLTREMRNVRASIPVHPSLGESPGVKFTPVQLFGGDNNDDY